MRGRRAWWVGTLLCVLVAVRAGWAQGAALPLLPSAVVSDAAGNLYIADRARNEVIESSAAGALVVVAGTGEQGFAGDGGLAVAAELNGPQGLALGSDGTLYIADTGNERVRSVSASGLISTVAGTGRAGFGGDGAAAVAAMLRGPVGLAVDASGALLIADAGNHRVRRVSGGVISTVAGTGEQGFAGDGGAATAAMLDSPGGVAVMSDGRIVIADTRNERLRVVAVDGTMATLAGDGVAGFAGDGGPASGARLAEPRGVAVLADGTVLVADSENHRLRAIGGDGVIRTLVGTGVQGASAEGTAGLQADLNAPRGVAVSAYARPVFAEASNRLVRALLGDSRVYSASGLMAARRSTVALTVPGAAVYGAAPVSVAVSGGAATPMGDVVLSDGGAVVASSKLANGSATFAGLSAGSHALAVRYGGDGFNPAATSAVSNVSVARAALVATANDVTVAYGAAAPTVTGTMSGVLPQDDGRVQVVFATSAVAGSAVGMYPIAVSLTGSASANYSVSLASGVVHVVPAASTTTTSAPAEAYSGLPLTLTAMVAPATSGAPTGRVVFYDAGVQVASGLVSGGAATAVLASPGAGTHAFTAAYSGDGNFLASTSGAMTATVSAMPDFTMAVSGTAAQTVGVGTMAAFQVSVGASPGPFSGAVSLSASGLPSGAAVAFAPQALVPGSGAVVTTMTVPTATLLARSEVQGPWTWLAVALPLVMWKRRRVRGAVCMLAVGMLAGCGARTIPEGGGRSKSYVITVTGTGTNLAGAVVTHSTQVSLTVE